ncbi:MAG TPA: hypothetical protein VHH88_11710, partial [Verrucomicrobiae bacterium]|nr:hypothetical protein [Verrucomicrobiae bacterium]
SAKHPFQMPPRNETVLNLDLAQQGLGGENSWGRWPHDNVLLPCKEYTYRFRLRPISSLREAEKFGRVVLPETTIADTSSSN